MPPTHTTEHSTCTARSTPYSVSNARPLLRFARNGVTLYPAVGTVKRSRMTTPLAGITVLDFGQIYQGPYATMLMAKAGATVIKIEPPGGEPLRRRVIATGGDTTLPMAMLNANKRAVTLNLKSPAGKDLL